MGQVLGSNHAASGFYDVGTMISAMIMGENAHLIAMAKYIRHVGADTHLRNENWEGFARLYNGPGYRKNKYDTKLAEAYQKYKSILPDITLRRVQAALLYMGYQPGPIDGIPGRKTRQAIAAFREKNGIAENGLLDAATQRKIFTLAGI